MKTSNPSVLIKTLLSLGSIFVVLIVFEVILRFFGMAEPILYRADPLFGYEPKPNQSSTRLGIPIFINDVGLRDNENFSEMDRGTIILVIGDSVTYGGSRIKQSSLFTELLESRLLKSERRVKILNAGVNGYSITQMVNRAKHLITIIKPDFLIIYAIRDDFFRPPITFIANGNFIYPVKKPRFAVVEFLTLSTHFLNSRYDFLRYLPDACTHWLARPRNYAPEYDRARIMDINFASLSSFISNNWVLMGRKRGNVLIFLSPGKTDLAASRAAKNEDLLTKFRFSHLRAYDLQNDFYSWIVSRNGKFQDYFWDNFHFTEKGHALAANVIYQYFLTAIDDGDPGRVVPAKPPPENPHGSC